MGLNGISLRKIVFTSVILAFLHSLFVNFNTVVESQSHASTLSGENITAVISPSSVDIQHGNTHDVEITFSKALVSDAVLSFTYQFGNNISMHEDPQIVVPLKNLPVKQGDNTVVATLRAQQVGSVIVGIHAEHEQFGRLDSAYVRVEVVRSTVLVSVIAVIGWIYFFAWSISFYPQIISNFRRKSVIGLNFDFLALNITGFLAYGVFNVAMFWIPDIMRDYQALHPRGVNPVQLNDVVFTLHAVAATTFTIFQCCIFERGEQRMSWPGMALVAGSWLFAAACTVPASLGALTWLDYVYYFSYIKLAVTLVKYVPQVYMNFRRKSTEGWSIGNVLGDFTGGFFSILQMFLLAFNNDDWSSMFGDPTKFGLGALSMAFDVVFIVQHYLLYRPRPYVELDESHTEEEVPQPGFYDGT